MASRAIKKKMKKIEKKLTRLNTKWEKVHTRWLKAYDNQNTAKAKRLMKEKNALSAKMKVLEKKYRKIK